MMLIFQNPAGKTDLKKQSQTKEGTHDGGLTAPGSLVQCRTGVIVYVEFPTFSISS